MPEVTLTKSGGMLFGADDYSRSYIKKQPQGVLMKLKLVTPKQTRRALLNRFSHAIYREAANLKKEGFETDEKAYCKYHHGIPVLCADPDDGEECVDYYTRLFKGFSYEDRIARMHENHKFYIPVTSLMTDAQMSMYLTRILQDYARQGYAILAPKEREWISYPEAA